MKTNTMIVFILLLLCSSLQAASQCSVVDIKVKDQNFKKIYITELGKGEVKLKFLYKKEVVSANPFFCYQRKGYAECFGDDDSGKFILKKGSLKIEQLTIRTEDDSFHIIKSSLTTFPVKKIPCK